MHLLSIKKNHKNIFFDNCTMCLFFKTFTIHNIFVLMKIDMKLENYLGIDSIFKAIFVLLLSLSIPCE